MFKCGDKVRLFKEGFRKQQEEIVTVDYYDEGMGVRIIEDSHRGCWYHPRQCELLHSIPPAKPTSSRSTMYHAIFRSKDGIVYMTTELHPTKFAVENRCALDSTFVAIGEVVIEELED